MNRLRLPPWSIARLCALLVLALGVATLLGWALGIGALVHIRPDWGTMVVNTAIGFVLAGGALLAATSPGPAADRLATLFGLLIALLALEELLVLVFDLSPALSQPQLHRAFQPDYAHPGRVAPNTATGLLIFAAGLLASLRRQRESAGAWPERAAIALMALGALGVVGYSLRLEYMYGWSGVTRMAVQTGLALIVLGIGLWSLAGIRGASAPVSDNQEVAAVSRTATVLLLLVAASAGVGGFAFLQGQVERQISDELLRISGDRDAWLEQNLRDRSARASLASDNDELAARLRALSSAPRSATALAALRQSAGALQRNGFSSVIAEAGGRRWQLAGSPSQPRLLAPLQGGNPGWLLWQDGYLLRRALPVRDDAGRIGSLITEQRLPALAAMIAATNRLGATGEMALCVAAGADHMNCFPMRGRPQPSRLTRVAAGQPRPMDYALRGKSGIIIASDYRQHRVLAAYRPVGDTGLGLVIKRDIAEIYAPIRRQFERIVVFLALLLGGGLWAMRQRLRPLLHRLQQTRAEARATSARLEAAVESKLDAFFVLECMRDDAGAIIDMRFVLLNERGEQVLARPRAEVIGHGMCELFPFMRQNGMFADCVRVVETGQSLVEVRASVVGRDRWLHMQLVALGDGVGLTVRDVTDDRLASDQLRQQALTDPLTGVANRAGFELALGRAIADAQRSGAAVVLGLLDLDEFKRINDTLGHAAGDRLLQEVATRLRHGLRPSDTVARLGGDEFALVLSHIEYPAGAAVVASKLLAALAAPMLLDGHAITVTGSLGVSAFPQHGSSAAALLKAADTAMYRAKRAGRNGYALF